MKKTKLIVHCSDTPAHMDIGAEEIRAWHVEGNGWADIAYAAVIRRDGTIEPGRDLDADGDVFDEVGAHAKGHNIDSVGVCLVGGRGDVDGLPENNFTDAQFRSLKVFAAKADAKLGRLEKLGHCDLPDVIKACPCFDVKEFFKPKKEEVVEMKTNKDAIVTEVAIPVVKQLFTKPETWTKEASAGSIVATAVPVYMQYASGGVENVSSAAVVALLTTVIVLCTRLYAKHKAK